MPTKAPSANSFRCNNPGSIIDPQALAIFDALPYYVVLVDEDHRLLAVNRAFRETIGKDEDQILGQYCPLLVHGLDHPFPGCPLEEAISAGSGIVEKDLYDQDQKRWYQSGIYPTTINTDKGRRTYLHTVRDITVYKSAEKALQASEEQYHSLFEESGDAVFIVTPEGKFMDVNPACIDLFGYSSKEEMLSLNVRENLFYTPEDRDSYQQLLESAGAVKDYELHLKTKMGDKLIVLETTSAVRDEKGRILAYRGIMRDVTQHRQLQAQLLQSHKMESVGRLAGGIAHDFNNVLTVILGNCELLMMSIEEEGPLYERIHPIQKSGMHAQELTQKLLGFSRKQIVAPRVLNLNDVINSLEPLLRRVIGEDIEVNVHYGEKPGHVSIDPGQVKQILMNLIVNASEAMFKGGTLTIETTSVELDTTYVLAHPYISIGQYSMIAVSDTGHGISEEIKTQIFEPFFTSKDQGTGLGLSTVYGIIKQNNGSIEVDSKEGVGTTFRLYLPVVEAPAESYKTEEKLTELPRGEETIIIAEDTEEVRLFTAGVLKDLGYNVYDFPNAEDAAKFFEEYQGTCSLLLTDVVMTGDTGFDLAVQLQALKPSLRVLFMSGHISDTVDQHGGLKEGMEILHKPFTPAMLASEVRKVLDH